MSALWGVIIGGLLTVGGQLAAEAWKAHVANSERTERRAAVAREFQRQALTSLQDAATAYRRALIENEREEVPSAETEDRLRTTRGAFQTALYRVSSDTCRQR